MQAALKELWTVFWDSCKETPKGMFMPFVAFWITATRNPVLDPSSERRQHGA